MERPYRLSYSQRQVCVVGLDLYLLGRCIHTVSMKVSLDKGIAEVHTDEMPFFGKGEDKYKPDCAHA